MGESWGVTATKLNKGSRETDRLQNGLEQEVAAAAGEATWLGKLRFQQVACKSRFLLFSTKKEFPAGNPEQFLEKRSGPALFSEDRRSASKAQIPGMMRGPWLLFLFVGVTLVVAVISEAEVLAVEGGPTSEDASEKEGAHPEQISIVKPVKLTGARTGGGSRAAPEEQRRWQPRRVPVWAEWSCSECRCINGRWVWRWRPGCGSPTASIPHRHQCKGRCKNSPC
nr:coiled-coil domain-containing protein 12 isoform X1 [Zootoca vivipara]